MSGGSVNHLIMQNDGNLVLYNASGVVQWASFDHPITKDGKSIIKHVVKDLIKAAKLAEKIAKDAAEAEV